MSKKVGRPSKMTESTVTKLEYAFSIGCNDSEACLYADISRNTYYRWLEENEGLRDRFEELKSKPILKAKEVVMKDLEENDSATAKWLLERRSAEFKPSSKTEITGENGGPLKTEWVLTPVKSNGTKD